MNTNEPEPNIGCVCVCLFVSNKSWEHDLNATRDSAVYIHGFVRVNRDAN